MTCPIRLPLLLLLTLATLVAVLPTAHADERCANTCTDSGRCTWDAAAERCVASSDADCSHSFGCELHGTCALGDGVCAPGEDAHCQGTFDCDELGLCTYDAASARCVATE